MKRFVIMIILAGVVLSIAPVHAETRPKVLLIPREGHPQPKLLDLMLINEIGVMVSMIEKAGFEVVIATASGAPEVGPTATLRPDLKLNEVKVSDYVGLILACKAVGAFPVPPQPPEAIAIVKQAVAQGKPIAAQFGAVGTLADAGVLKGKQYAFLEDPLKETDTHGTDSRFTGAIYSGYGVVQDGKIITSGVCPAMAWATGLPDCTVELTEAFIAEVKSEKAD